MRRSDAKQVRRRLTCAAVRVEKSLLAVQRRLDITFMQAQKFEQALNEYGAPTTDFDVLELEALETQQKELREDAATLSDLAAWYKAGHEQLNQMLLELDTYLSRYLLRFIC